MVDDMSLSTNDWTRHGKGSVFQFCLGDTELLRVFNSALLPEYAPYSIIGTYKEKKEGQYIGVHREVIVSDLLELKERGIWQFFIRSKTISAGLILEDSVNIDAFLAVNGLINVQHGRSFRGELEMSSVGVVGEVTNLKMGNLLKHVEYIEIYKNIKKAIRNQIKS